MDSSAPVTYVANFVLLARRLLLQAVESIAVVVLPSCGQDPSGSCLVPASLRETMNG